jgi:peptidylprolyl isomerase/peptidyl-prolyl cis-trans isomerase C
MLRGYLELKLAWELFNKGPETLAAAEKQRLDEVARKQEWLEQRILASPEALQIVVPATTLQQRLDEIRARYPDHPSFQADLQRIGLDSGELEKAVNRDLLVEAVLEKVAAGVAAATPVDAEIYYRLHPEAFTRPEVRLLRHILITFDNPQQKDKARTQLEQLRQTLADGEAFAAAALRHSQCPTALEGGKLGHVKPGQLYAELEPAAFALAAGELSPVVESPMGLHLLRCDEIPPSGPLPYPEVEPRILDHLNQQRRSKAQRDWIKALTRTRQ